MKEKHYTKEISAYLNHELPKDDRQLIAQHLLQCENCRKEHDEIKLGVGLAHHLARADAPAGTWNAIERALHSNSSKTKRLNAPIWRGSFFNNPRNLTATAAALLIVCALATAVYFGLIGNKPLPEIVENEEPVNRRSNVAMPQIAAAPDETLTGENTLPGTQIPPPPPDANSNGQVLPKVDRPPPASPAGTLAAPNNQSPPPASWNVETIVGNQSRAEKGKLGVGEFLETDASSRAKIQVADIGQVTLAPNSRVQLVNTHVREHRLSLERGLMQAKIFAPPRLFIVDTPSAVAVDLGCEYTLEVDRGGNSRLHVTSGYVALERDGRESIVPAGAVCLTKKGKGLGTPFSDDASAAFQKALYNFDFESGGAASVQAIIREANLYDALTLWHLLARVAPGEQRARVFDALAARVKPPAAVSREAVLQRLDKKMLDAWWLEIENVWFE